MNKFVLVLVLLAIMSFAVSAVTQEEIESCICTSMDVDGDQSVTADDMTVVKSYDGCDINADNCAKMNFNGDNNVNLIDMAYLKSEINCTLATSDCTDADINNDGYVNKADLDLFIRSERIHVYPLCEDTDEGFDPLVQGTLEWDLTLYTDFCEDEDILTEYFCDQADMMHANPYNCTANGMACDHGACIEIGDQPVLTCEEADVNNDSVVSNSDLIYIRIRRDQTNCNPENNYCEAADVNKDGVVNVIDLILVRDMRGLICEDHEPTCTDSDGLDYYTKGSAVVTEPNGEVTVYTDYCRYPDQAGPGPFVNEFACSEDFGLYDLVVECPNGCYNGACVTDECSDHEISIGDVRSSNGKIVVDYKHRNVDDLKVELYVSMILEDPNQGAGAVRECEITMGECGIDEDSEVEYCTIFTDCDYPKDFENKEYTIKLSDLECDEVYDKADVNPLPTCYDSDGGLDYYEFGYTEVCQEGSNSGSCVGREDRCIDVTMLEETYCGKDDTIQVAKYKCPGICEGGKCVSNGARDMQPEPVLGSPRAQVQILAYMGYQCPFSKRSFDTLTEIVDDYDGKVSLTFTNFPMEFHENSETAAVAGECVLDLSNEDTFFKFSNALMSHQGILTVDDLIEYAADFNVKIKDCLGEEEFLPEVLHDLEVGKNKGVKGTPTFFVNGKMYVGDRPYSEWQQIIDEILDDNPIIVRKLQLEEGWNLLPIGRGVEFEFDDDIEDYLEAAYVYVPWKNQYYDIIEDEYWLAEMLDEYAYTAIWVYLNNDIDVLVEVDLDEVQTILETFDFEEFEEGWNYFVVLPHMQEDYEDGYLNIGMRDGQVFIRGSVIYSWDNEDKEWYSEPYKRLLNDDLIKAGIVGQPILINYIDDFTAEFIPNSTPDIPDFPI